MNDLNLYDGEYIILFFRRHGSVFFSQAVVSAMLAVFPFVVWWLVHTSFDLSVPELAEKILLFASMLWVCALWIRLFVFWTNYWLENWVITDRRLLVIGERGLFHRTTTSYVLEDVQNVGVEVEGLLQEMFRYGTAEIALRNDVRLTIRDVPDPARVEKAIQAHRSRVQNLEEAAKRQKEILRLVAHEVKGYLARNVAVLSEIVAGDFGAVSDPLKNIAGRALSGTKAGVGELMDILNERKGNQTDTRSRKESFDLRDEARAIVERERPTALEKGLTLEMMEDTEPCMVLGDKQTLRERVLRNLMENAINYTRQGSIVVGTTTIEGTAVFWVQDSGVGISAEDMPLLFTEGGRGSHSQETNPNSTGFGLFTAKQVVEAHGGRIWAESEGAGKGAKFYVVLPLKQ